MPRAVVTGGHGFIGSHLVEHLVRRGDDVTVLDPAPPPPDLATGAYEHVRADVRDGPAVAAAVAGADLVLHLSAVVGVDRYLERPLDVLDVNVLGTRAVLEAATAADARVVVASTSEVFGRNPQVPWHEDSDRVLGSTATDRWSYSSSKAVAEHLTHAFTRQHGLRASIVRYFNVYGPRQRPAYLVSRTVHRVLRGLEPLVYDDGEQTRCLTYVADAVAGTALAAGTAAEGRTYNLGRATPSTVREVVDTVTRTARGRVRAATVATADVIGDRYEDVPLRAPDPSRAERELGWRADTHPDDGIATTVEWARRNPWWLDPAAERGWNPAPAA